MAKYEASILRPDNWNSQKGYHVYPQRISEVEVLRLAGIKSRSTLSAPYHQALRRELTDFIKSLKTRTGKFNKKGAKTAEYDEGNRLETMAQIIAALRYENLLLKEELRKLKKSKEASFDPAD